MSQQVVIAGPPSPQPLGVTDSPRWNDITIGAGTHLFEDAVDILAQRNSTNAQEFRVYKTFTDTSNFSRVSQGFINTPNVYEFSSESLGIGTANNFAFMATKFGIGTNVPTTFFEVSGTPMVATFTETSNNRSIKISPGSGAIDSVNAGLNLNRFAGLAVQIGFSSDSRLILGQESPTALGLLHIGSTIPGVPNLLLKAAPSHTSEIMLWKDSADVSLGAIDFNGNLGVGTDNPTGKFAIGGDNARPFTQQKSTLAAVAPTAGHGMLRWEVGTNAGTLKLVAYSGTSITGVTVLDNIGAGN